MNNDAPVPHGPQDTSNLQLGRDGFASVAVKSNQRLTPDPTLEFTPSVPTTWYFYSCPYYVQRSSQGAQAGHDLSTPESLGMLYCAYTSPAPRGGGGNVEARSPTLPIISRGSAPWQVFEVR